MENIEDMLEDNDISKAPFGKKEPHPSVEEPEQQERAGFRREQGSGGASGLSRCSGELLHEAQVEDAQASQHLLHGLLGRQHTEPEYRGPGRGQSVGHTAREIQGLPIVLFGVNVRFYLKVSSEFKYQSSMLLGTFAPFIELELQSSD